MQPWILWNQSSREEQITCAFRRCGKIKLAAKPQHYEKIARGFEILHREADPDTDLVQPENTRQEVGSDRFHGGLLYKKSAQMHMGQFGAGLATAARRNGARIYENAAVNGLKRLSGARHLVSTARGAITASQVLIATGPSMRGPFFYFRRRVIPIGSFIIATEPLAAAQLDSIMPTRRTATTTLNIGNYFRIAPDDRLIFGGRARFALSSPTSDLKSGQILEATLHETFPQLGNVRIDYCWGGIIDLTADRLPRAGEHNGLFYAMGFSGHGAQMSVHMGQQMAAVMAGDPAANPLRNLTGPPYSAISAHPGSCPSSAPTTATKTRPAKPIPSVTKQTGLDPAGRGPYHLRRAGALQRSPQNPQRLIDLRPRRHQRRQESDHVPPHSAFDHQQPTGARLVDHPLRQRRVRFAVAAPSPSPASARRRELRRSPPESAAATAAAPASSTAAHRASLLQQPVRSNASNTPSAAAHASACPP